MKLVEGFGCADPPIHLNCRCTEVMDLRIAMRIEHTTNCPFRLVGHVAVMGVSGRLTNWGSGEYYGDVRSWSVSAERIDVTSIGDATIRTIQGTSSIRLEVQYRECMYAAEGMVMDQYVTEEEQHVARLKSRVSEIRDTL